MTDTRYTLGGDEHLFVELSEAMSLHAFFRSILITQELAARTLPGVTEICPANASYQVRFAPDVLPGGQLQDVLTEIEGSLGPADASLSTRIVEIRRPDQRLPGRGRLHRGPLRDPVVRVQFRPVDRAEYDEILAAVERNDYVLRSAPVDFSLADFEADPAGYPAAMLEALHAH